MHYSHCNSSGYISHQIILYPVFWQPAKNWSQSKEESGKSIPWTGTRSQLCVNSVQTLVVWWLRGSRTAGSISSRKARFIVNFSHDINVRLLFVNRNFFHFFLIQSKHETVNVDRRRRFTWKDRCFVGNCSEQRGLSPSQIRHLPLQPYNHLKARYITLKIPPWFAVLIYITF